MHVNVNVKCSALHHNKHLFYNKTLAFNLYFSYLNFRKFAILKILLFY